MRAYHLFDLDANSHYRIQCDSWLLEDNRDSRSPDHAHFRLRRSDQLHALEPYRPRDLCVIRQKPKDRHTESRLSRPGFTEDADDFPPSNLKIDRVKCRDGGTCRI